MIEDYQEAVAWIAYATKMDGAHVIALRLTEKQTFAVGCALKENKLLNPPRERESKRYAFTCACPCRKAHVTTYKTKRPKYISPAHKAAAFRAGNKTPRLSFQPVYCLTCMDAYVKSVDSPIEAERLTCETCLDDLL